MMCRNRTCLKVYIFLVLWSIIVLTYRLVGINFHHLPRPVCIPGKPQKGNPCLSVAQKELMEEILTYAQNNTKVILAWSGEKHPARYIRPSTKYLERECGSCMVTTDNSLINKNDTAAVVVNYLSVLYRSAPPKKRRPNLIYVYQSGEPPPIYTRGQRLNILQAVDSMHFNDTILPWRDSSIYGPYGSARKAREHGLLTFNQHFAGDMKRVMAYKTKMAIAVMSNCKVTVGARLRFVFIKALQNKGFNVEGYGRCFKHELPRTVDKLHFSETLMRYKFYFAFENSYHCKDYITEKFYSNGFSNLAIPVVWGTAKEDYEAVAPPNSFIHVDDFKSIQELIDYLNHLDKNDDAFLQYLKWIHQPVEKMPNYSQRYGFCQLCRNIHGINIDDVYKPSFNESRLERPMITKNVWSRNILPLQEMLNKTDSKECFWKIPQILADNNTLIAQLEAQYIDPLNEMQNKKS